MVEKYKHISEMESVLEIHGRKLGELHELLDYLKEHADDFRRLVDYYYSDQRQRDLEDDEKGLMDEGLKRGVLSEDGIYNLLADYHAASIKMLELSADYFKHQ